MRKSSGFTLIELLVVIAIIAILAAILFPTFARAKKEAQKTQCVANLHQLFLAVSQYCNDYSGDTPTMAQPWEWGGSSWQTYMPFLMHKLLGPYIKDDGVCSCPAWKSIEVDGDQYHDQRTQMSRYTWGPNGYSFALAPPWGSQYVNYAFPYPSLSGISNPGYPRELALLKEPARYILMYCNTMNDHAGYGDTEIAGPNGQTGNLVCLCVHGDGHTELIRFGVTNMSEFGAEPNRSWELWWNAGYPKGERAFADGA